MHTDSFHHNDVDIHKMNSKANFIGALGSSLFVLAIFGCILLTAVVLIVGITHWSLLVVACTVFFCGSLIFFGIKGFLVLIREGATTYATVVHAAFEHRRSGNIFLADPNRVVVREGAPLLIESTRTINETHQYHEDELLLPEQAETLHQDAPPMRQALNTIERVARENQKLHMRDKKWLIGYAEGKPKIGKLYDLRSCAFGGVQGQGKSSSMTFHAYQAAAHDFRLLVIDPHLHSDEGLAPRLSPIRDSFLVPPVGDEEEEIVAQFEWLQATLDQRKRPGGMKNAQVIIVFMDELNELLRAIRDKQKKHFVTDTLLNITQGGRKFGIFLMAAAQDWQNTNIGGADVRYSFPSRICHKAESPAMTKLLNCTETTLAQLCDPPLRSMQAVINTANGELYRFSVPQSTLEDGAACDEIRLRVKNGRSQMSMNRPTHAVSGVSEVDEDATTDSTTSPLPGFGSDHFRNTGNLLHFPQGPQGAERSEVDDTGSGSHDAQTEKIKIMRMMEAGYSKTKMMQELWDTPKGGHQYQRDSERLSRIQAEIMRGVAQQGRGQ